MLWDLIDGYTGWHMTYGFLLALFDVPLPVSVALAVVWEFIEASGYFQNIGDPWWGNSVFDVLVLIIAWLVVTKRKANWVRTNSRHDDEQSTSTLSDGWNSNGSGLSKDP